MPLTEEELRKAYAEAAKNVGGMTATARTANTQNRPATPAAPAAPVRPTWAPSAALTAAQEAYNNYLNNAPGAYNSQYATQIADTNNAINNYGDFAYDPNNDAAYQQYRDMYTNQGQRAMRDTMGQAAAMSGGYGSSFGATAGNLAYQDYMGRLNGVIPELRNQALGEWNQGKADLYNQLNSYSAMDNNAMAAWQTNATQYNNNLAAAQSAYQGLYNTEWGQYQDAMDQYNVAMQQQREDEQFNRLHPENTGGNGGGGRSTSRGFNEVKARASAMLGQYGENDAAVMRYLNGAVSAGLITGAEAQRIKAMIGVGAHSGNNRTPPPSGNPRPDTRGEQ